jgi:hypothetical protein
MTTPKRYIHDRIVLTLLTVNTFFASLIAVKVILSLSGNSTKLRIIEHRPSLGLSANKIGTTAQMASFIVFPLAVLLFHTLLSIRVYHLRRRFAHVVLAMGTLLIILTGVVSYFLLQ